MKKEWLLVVVSVSLTLIIALTLVRWFAPQLLGLPVDLQMVQVAKEVPPFFDGIFRPEDYASQEYIIQDPYIKRAKPLFPRFLGIGPNDLLGFRNRNVPNIADIITIGDSQTYGNNAFVEQNWPSILAESMTHNSSILYNMSVGGWGATEYFEIFNKALYLQPEVVIVAFYTGNDPLETFYRIYGDDRWKSLRLNPDIKASDAPTLEMPLPDSSFWNVQFNDGTETILTPNLRYLSNKRNHPAVMVGYEIMGEIARKMGEIAEKNKIKLVFTIIPTKELAFKKKIMTENIIPREDYTDLVNDEEKNILAFTEKLKKIPGSVYVDLIDSLQQGVLDSQQIYPSDQDGHPFAGGYKLIGETLQHEVVKLLPDKLNGLFFAPYSIKDDKYRPFLVKNSHFYIFTSKRILKENGWTEENMTKVDLRAISKLSFGGFINTVEPALYGPIAFKK